jgi:hypothetical protein
MHDTLSALQAVAIVIIMQASENTHDEAQCIELILAMEVSVSLISTHIGTLLIYRIIGNVSKTLW